MADPSTTQILRTPDACFEGLPDFPFAPRYADIEDEQFGSLRIHYLDEGPPDGRLILCLHGEPTWCFLYRHMIPVFTAAGFRVVAPDLVGFGRSDKPAAQEDYSYSRHVAWMQRFITALDLRDMTLIAQDWGGLIGLRLAAENGDRFAAISLSNTGLPTGDQGANEAFLRWQKFSQDDPEFDIGVIVNGFGRGRLTEAEIDAYRAPFPEEDYKAGARRFPMLVPIRPDDPASGANRLAWGALMKWEKPMLLAFSDGDPITAGADRPFLKLVPGTRGQPHLTLHGGHFIQEEDGVRWARAVRDWLKAG